MCQWFFLWTNKQPTSWVGSRCACWYVSVCSYCSMYCIILHWKSAVRFSMGSLHKDLQLSFGDLFRPSTLSPPPRIVDDTPWHKADTLPSSPNPQTFQALELGKSAACPLPLPAGPTIREGKLYWPPSSHCSKWMSRILVNLMSIFCAKALSNPLAFCNKCPTLTHPALNKASWRKTVTVI